MIACVSVGALNIDLSTCPLNSVSLKPLKNVVVFAWIVDGFDQTPMCRS